MLNGTVDIHVSDSQADDNTAFAGCIFRVEFDNHWPLKRIFQEPRPDYVDVDPSFDSVREERCGFEEILPEPVPEEVRYDQISIVFTELFF